MEKTFIFSILSASAIGAASAVTIAGTDFDGIVGVDAFSSGGSAGNTVRTTGSGFYSAFGDISNDNLWRTSSNPSGRLNAFLGAGYAATIGLESNDLLESASVSKNAPGLTTSISGLAPNMYDVYVVYISRETGGPDQGGINASFGGGSFVASTALKLDRLTKPAVSMQTGNFL